MADQSDVFIKEWPESPAKLEHGFVKDGNACPVSVSFADTPANVTLSTAAEQPLRVGMDMQVSAPNPIPVGISIAEPICARSEYSIGIRIFDNPFASIDLRGTTRLFQCGDKTVVKEEEEHHKKGVFEAVETFLEDGVVGTVEKIMEE